MLPATFVYDQTDDDHTNSNSILRRWSLVNHGIRPGPIKKYLLQSLVFQHFSKIRVVLLLRSRLLSKTWVVSFEEVKEWGGILLNEVVRYFMKYWTIPIGGLRSYCFSPCVVHASMSQPRGDAGWQCAYLQLSVGTNCGRLQLDCL